MLRKSLKMELGGHWRNGAYTPLMFQFLELLLSCWSIANLSSRLNKKHLESMIDTWTYMDFTSTSSLWPDHLSAFFTLKGTVTTGVMWNPASPQQHGGGGGRWWGGRRGGGPQFFSTDTAKNDKSERFRKSKFYWKYILEEYGSR